MLVSADTIDDVAYNWRLPEILEQHDITPYRLRQTMLAHGVTITDKTVYRWAKELPETVSVSHLMGVITALRELTGEKVQVGDLLEYIPDN